MVRSPERVALFFGVDRRGREIVLYEDTWYDHILDTHAEMTGQIDQVEQAITAAERITQDRSDANRQCYYRNGNLPWPYDRDVIKVVVEFEESGQGEPSLGVVVTAYPVEVIPSREHRLW